jgi:hypothetical protein
MTLEQEEAVLMLASLEALLAGHNDLILQGEELTGLILILAHVRQKIERARPPHAH